jgi:hypothetical protein
MWDLVKITITLAEFFSAVICFVLVWFMMKPYRLTGDARFLGLPLGFVLLGISHAIATAVQFSSGVAWYWFMLIFRTFSFVFLATTYLFSSRSSKKTQHLWNITVSTMIVVIFTLSLLVLVAPQLWESVGSSQIYWRILMVISLCYIITVTIKNHFKKPNPMTLWIPFGFIFLAISQCLLIVYSLVNKVIDNSINVYWSTLVFRFAGLIMFLVVAYRTYYNSKEDRNAKNT